jgi:transmembrane sensor
MDQKYWITKLLTENISPEERENFLNEIEKDQDKKTEYLKYINLWKLTSLGNSPTSYLTRNRLFEKFWKRKTRSTSFMVIMRDFLRYAAVFIAAISLLYLVQYITGNNLFSNKEAVIQEYKLETNYGSISNFQIEDGSTIWLNTNSKIIITEMKKKWIVQLKGEAFFDILHNEDREFHIDLGDLVIIDRGTRFNISAYPEDSISRAVLIEGEVEVRNLLDHSRVQLSAGEGYVYNKKSRVADLIQVDGGIESSWKDGKFVFIDKSLRQICDNLSKWYNVEFIYSNQALADTRYTCILRRTTTVNQIMKILNSTSDIDYEIISNDEGSKDTIRLK